MGAREELTALLGRAVADVTPLGGAYRVRLADGTEVVAKRHAHPSAVFAEVAGLRWLRTASGPLISSVAADTDSPGDSSGNRQDVHPPNPSESPVGAPGGPPVSTLRQGADTAGGLNGNREEVHLASPGERSIGAPGGPPDSMLSGSTDSSGAAGGKWEEVHLASPGERSFRAPGGPPDSMLSGSTDNPGGSGVGGPFVPRVLEFDDEWLVVEVGPGGRASPAVAEGFGRELARLHQAGAAAFGSAPPGGPVDAWIGLAPMRNVTGAAWGEWYVEHRVLPYLRVAVDRGAVLESAPIEAVCARVGEVAGPAEPPARLHGDLWNGNLLWGDRVWLIDPAAHGGHRETDLAMLRLFGCSYLDRIVGAYHEVSPLADGWRERVALHQLFPLLVHAVLFGGGYGGQAVAAARSLA